MIEQAATVVKLSGDLAWLETQAQAGCTRCQAASGCSTSWLAKALAKRPQSIKVPAVDNLHLGQQVRVAVQERTLLQASALIYLLPILVLLGSALFASWALPLVGLAHELWQVLSCFLLTGLTFVGIQHMLKQGGWRLFQAQILPTPTTNRIPVQQLDH